MNTPTGAGPSPQLRPPETHPTRRALTLACALAGHACEGATLISDGENTLYRLRDSTVVRVTRPGFDRVAAASREVAVARWLQQEHIPANRALPGHQPHIVGHPPAVDETRAVTFWRALPRHRHGAPGEVGAALRALHNLPIPAAPMLPPLDPFARLADRISTARSLPDPDRRWLADHLAALRERHDDTAVSAVSPRVVHGDAWGGNIITTLVSAPGWPGGTTVLIDLERVGVGDPRWDQVSIAIKHTSFDWIDGDEYAAFVHAYGEDVTAADEFPLLRDIRELRMTCYLAQRAADRPEAAAEAQHRVDCLRGRAGARPWAWTAAA